MDAHNYIEAFLPKSLGCTTNGLLEFDRIVSAKSWPAAHVPRLINSWFLIGPSRWRTLFTTPYGIVLLAKLALFAVMLVLAALHRFRAAPTLRAALDTQRSTQPELSALRATLLTETTLALLVLLAVGLLGTLVPPISSE